MTNYKQFRDRATKESDTFYCQRILRPVSTRLSYLIFSVFGRVNPSLITIIGLMVGIIGQIALLFEHILIGIVMLTVWTILDGLDGELARFQSWTSSEGAFLDNVVDHIILVGLLYTACILSLRSSNPISMSTSLALPAMFLLSRLQIGLRAENILKADLNKGGDLKNELRSMQSNYLVLVGLTVRHTYEFFIRNYNMVNIFSFAFLMNAIFSAPVFLNIFLKFYIAVLGITALALIIGFYLELRNT